MPAPKDLPSYVRRRWQGATLALFSALVPLLKGCRGRPRPALDVDEARGYYFVLHALLSFPEICSLALATKRGCDAVELTYDAFLEDGLVSH